MNNVSQPKWIALIDLSNFQKLLEKSRKQPILLFKYNAKSADQIQLKANLEKQWLMEHELENYLLDTSQNSEIGSYMVDEFAVPDLDAQIIIFAEGDAIYEESGEEITVKKINLAIRIINRTFKWSETRSTKKASG